MEAHIKAINSIVSPAEAACEFGLQPRVQDNACVIDCPNCSKPMFVLETGFVCASHNCNFKAGSIIDIMALTEKISINRACDYFFEAFEYKAKKMSRYKDAEFVNELATHLKQRRKLFEFFLRRRNNEPKKAYMVQAYSALHKAGINLRDNKLIGFVLSHEDLYELEDILRHFKAALPDVPGSTAALVVPYFSCHSVVDALTLSTPTKPLRNHKVVEIERNSRLTWAGLLQAHPAVTHVELAESAMDMLRINTAHARVGTGKELAMHCRYRSSAGEVAWKPASATYVVAEDSDTDPVIVLTRLDACLDNMTLRMRGADKPVREYVMESCISLLLKEGFSPQTKLMLEAAQLSEKDRQAILDKLHDSRAYATADQVRKFFRVVMVHKDDRGMLYVSPDGYLTAKDETADKVPVTNFTLDVQHNIVFPDSQDIFHATRLTVGDSTRDITLKPTDIDRVSDLEASVRFASGGTADDRLPTVRDKSCGRLLSSYLRYKIAESPKVEGIPFIGWNTDKTRFYGPYWYADKKGGCVQYDAVLHPFNPEMKYYSNEPFTARNFNSDIPAGAKTIIAQYAAMLVRGYLGLPVGAITYANDEDHVFVLSSIFKALGQVEVIPCETNWSRRTGSNINHRATNVILSTSPSGFGAFKNNTSHTRSAGVTDFGSGSFLCLPEGQQLKDIADVKDSIERVKGMQVHAVFEVLTWLLKTEAKTFKRVDSVSFAQSCAAEGNNIISEVYGLDMWNTRLSEYATLEAFLADVRYEEVNKYVCHNINEHIVTLDLSSRPDLPAADICTELKKLGAKNVSLTGHKVTADATSMMRALELYYHSKPEVQEEFDPAALLEIADT